MLRLAGRSPHRERWRPRRRCCSNLGYCCARGRRTPNAHKTETLRSFQDCQSGAGDINSGRRQCVTVASLLTGVNGAYCARATFVADDQIKIRGQGSSGDELVTSFPDDISEWVSPETLHAWVEEELRNLAAASPLPLQQQRILVILAFAYAQGIYRSTEILVLCDSDPLFKALEQGVDFSLENIKDLRHAQWGLLVSLLVRLFSRALARKHQLGDPLDPRIKRRLHERAGDRLNTAVNSDREQE